MITKQMLCFVFLKSWTERKIDVEVSALLCSSPSVFQRDFSTCWSKIQVSIPADKNCHFYMNQAPSPLLLRSPTWMGRLYCVYFHLSPDVHRHQTEKKWYGKTDTSRDWQGGWNRHIKSDICPFSATAHRYLPHAVPFLIRMLHTHYTHITHTLSLSNQFKSR